MHSKIFFKILIQGTHFSVQRAPKLEANTIWENIQNGKFTLENITKWLMPLLY